MWPARSRMRLGEDGGYRRACRGGVQPAAWPCGARPRRLARGLCDARAARGGGKGGFAALGRGAASEPRLDIHWPRHSRESGNGQEEGGARALLIRSEEHTSELQSLMRISYAVFCLKKKNKTTPYKSTHHKYHDKKQLKMKNKQSTSHQ